MFCFNYYENLKYESNINPLLFILFEQMTEVTEKNINFKTVLYICLTPS